MRYELYKDGEDDWYIWQVDEDKNLQRYLVGSDGSEADPWEEAEPVASGGKVITEDEAFLLMI